MPNDKRFAGWRLADIRPSAKGAPTVFSCFACGGGSSMGYKLAGFDVVGINEIDPKMTETYLLNARPKYVFTEPIQQFKNRESFPDELMSLDVLDGSPPCSTFSMAGMRERAWGKMKKFREGQAEQMLDRLFFDFLDLAERLKPKVVIAENVKGMLGGGARAYCEAIMERLRGIGYSPQLFLLNAAYMGVPQSRERVFFLAVRRDLGREKIRLAFNDGPIAVEDALSDIPDDMRNGRPLTSATEALWRRVKPGDAISSVHERGSCFNNRKLHPRRPSTTISASGPIYHWAEPRNLSTAEILRLSTFPDDYRTPKGTDSEAKYICGMSVPPRMVERVASEVRAQWLG